MRDDLNQGDLNPIQPNFAECRKTPGNHGE